METKRHSFLARAAMTLLLVMLTAMTAWAAEWPSYITNVVLVGGTESEAQTAKSDYSGYTWCSTSLNDGTSGDVIYIGYKTSNSANTNGGYITDFIVVDAVDHNPPSSVTCNGHTYYLCPADGGDYFANSNHGNLTSHASQGWNIYLYYTKEHFSDKRAVSSIAINDTKSGAIDCYKKDGTLIEENISLNRGVKNTPYVYMHIYTSTKVNRPYPEPTTISGLTYDGSPHQLIPSNYDSDYSGDVYFRLGTTGSYTSNVNSITATNAGTYTIYYYSGESYYGNSSVDYAHTMTATIAKSPNSGPTVTCADALESVGPSPSLTGTNLSTGTITYTYSTSQNGEYTTTKPTAAGTYWVKATIAGDNNCNEYTTAAVSFKLKHDWGVHNTGNTADNAYVISTTEDLNLLSSRVSAGNTYQGKFFKLGGNITYNKNTTNNFTPIGNSTYSFKGTFDGNGKTISGINISLSSTSCVGLFRSAGAEATIKNLKIDNSTIGGQSYVGSILGEGEHQTHITNCLVTSSVSVSGQQYYVGGIVGNKGTITGCASAASVSGNNVVGGIMGSGYQSTITNCVYTGSSVTSSGTSVGAIVGLKDEYTTLNYNYYTANLASKGCKGSDISGARKAVAINTADAVTVTPTGTATAYNISGITGYAGNNGMSYGGHFYAGATETVSLDITYAIDGFSVTGYTDGVGSPATDLTLVSDNTYTLVMPATTATVTPVGNDLWGVTTAGRDGSAEHPYIITTTEGLDLLAKKVNGGNSYSGKYFELGNDIDYSEVPLTLDDGKSNYTAIGYNYAYNNKSLFSGHFDGKGHTISGIVINKAANCQGLFSGIDGAEVKNLTITDATITVGSNNGTVGAIAGYSQNSAVIENCHVTSSVTVTALTGGSYGTYVGGIVGESIITTVRGCTSAATVSGNYSVGAIAGSDNKATIENCLVLGATISGNKYAGAIVGYINSSTHTNNLYIGTNVGGVGSAGDATGTDITGATIAYEFPTAISAMGAKGTTYAAGTDYEGVTAYANGLAYNGKYYYPSLWTGDGTSDNPYIIYTTAGLDKLASDVNGGNRYEGKYFELGNDITYDNTKENNYTPIGGNGYWFSGNFDGKGHTVSGIRISDTNGAYKAIFGGVISGNVKNLVVSDCRIEANQYIGGIVGSISNGTIENCHVLSNVTLTGHSYVGGIASRTAAGTIIGCTSAATITGTKANDINASALGGTVGLTEELGGNKPTLTDNLFTGTISGELEIAIGATVGYNVSNAALLTNNYYTTYGLGGVGSVYSATGSDEDGALIAMSSTAMPDEATIGTAGTAYAYQGITPYTHGLFYDGHYYYHGLWSGSGTENDPYVIRTTTELDKLASDVNGGKRYANTYFALGADITYDKTVANNYMPIGNNYDWFSGTFDGKGHTISGIRISETEGIYKAVFGYTDGTVKNLVVSDCQIEARQDIGGIVAKLRNGTIENCHVLSNVTLTGPSFIGGITAENEGGTIKGCTSATTITGTKISGMNAYYLGGISGYASENGEDSPTLTDNLFTGTISGDFDECIGAIVGRNTSGNITLTNNYHTCSGMGGFGREGLAIGYDLDGATIAYELAAANAAMGAVVSTYGTGDYTGITVYEHGLAYNGKFYSPSPWGGSGTEGDPYVIVSTAGLDLLATNVIGGNSYEDTYFVLGDNITYDADALTLDLDNDGNNDSNYMPVGKDGSSFYGNFDGQGHTISGIRVNTNNMGYIGVFGVNDGTVKNLTVSDCLFAGSSTVGAIAGLTRGTVENCHVATYVSVIGNNTVGGVVGDNEGSVLGCTSAAALSAKEHAAYFGGIAGYNSGTLTDNLFTGTIDKMSNSSICIGAITGYHNTELGGMLTNNFHTCSGMGGVGNDNDATSTDVDGALFAASSDTEPDAATIGTAGTAYAAGETYEGITPYTHGLYYNGLYYYKDPNIVVWKGQGTAENPYVIRTTAELDLLASKVNSGNKYDGKYFELGADITYDGSENNFTPIGDDGRWFYGSFDGKGHTISGIRISDTDGTHKAVFGYVCGTVKNLVVSDCRIEAHQFIGGIVGYLFGGTIENCHVGSNVTLTGYTYVGGIAADIVGGTIIGCTSAATITGTKDGGSNAHFLGGISGYASEYGDTPPTLTDNLFTGTISGDLDEYIGAIIGKNYSNAATLTNNYYTAYGLGGVGDEGSVIGSDEAGAQFAVSSTTMPDAATIGTAGTAYAKDETYQGITPYTHGLFYGGRYYYVSIWGGSGTEDDPYVIYNTAGLNKLASDVNDGNKYDGKYFELGADITYNKTKENNFTPIGNIDKGFYGTFDGKGHTISGIRISETNGTYKAIFGRIGGTVKNLVVSDCHIEARQDIGGIVAELFGTIENCHVLSDVTLTGYTYVGGITANIERGTIIGCTSAATITGTRPGGNAYSLGGIASFASEYAGDTSTLIDNLFTGTISGNLGEFIGAIVGENNSDGTTLTNNYYTCSGLGGVGDAGSTTGSDVAGALFAVSSNTKPDAATIGTAGTAYPYQGIMPYTHGLYYNGLYYYNDPNIVAWAGQGTETTPYVIRTTAELDLLATNVNGGESYNHTYFELGADINYDKTKENNFTPIGNNDYYFMGHFDGKGHKVSGLNIYLPENNHVGLFGFIYSGSVKNLTLTNSTIIGQQYVGSIAGQVIGDATIENCHVTSDCDVNGDYCVGGIVGITDNCTIGGCTSAATVSGKQYVGGIVGSNNGSIKDCLYMGNVVSATPWAVGAIVGYNISDAATLTNNYYTQSGVGGVNGIDEAGKAEFAVSSTTKPDEATIGTAGTAYAAGETYEGITPYTHGLFYSGRYYWHGTVRRGDANGDSVVNISDAVAIVNYILGKEVPAGFNVAAADVNGDGKVTISDAVMLVNMIGSQP